MGLDSCVMKEVVEKTWKEGQGIVRREQEGTVRSFIVNDSKKYRMVFNHIKGCGSCDPGEALRAHLVKREVRKLGGLVSDELLKYALRYRKQFGDRVPDDVLKEFVLRSMDSSPRRFLENCGMLSQAEVLRGFRMVHAFWTWQSNAASGRAYRSEPMRTMSRALAEGGGGTWQGNLVRILCQAFLGPSPVASLPPGDEELMEAVTAALVMRA